MIAEHAPEGALVEIDDARKPPRWAGQFVASVRIESFDDSVARYLLRRSDPPERLVNRSLEQTLSKPRRDRSALGYLWVALPCRCVGSPCTGTSAGATATRSDSRTPARGCGGGCAGDRRHRGTRSGGTRGFGPIAPRPRAFRLTTSESMTSKPVRSSGTRIASTEGPPFFDGLVTEETKEASLQFS